MTPRFVELLEQLKATGNDPYSVAVTDFISRWVPLMEQQLALAPSFVQVAEQTVEIADKGIDVSLAQYGFALEWLVANWEYGPQLHAWQNAKYGMSTQEPVRNPAKLPLPQGGYAFVAGLRRDESLVRDPRMQAHFNVRQRPPESTAVKATSCPHCNAVLDMVTGPSGHKPSPGDLTVCLSCASVLQFNDEMVIEAMSEEEIRALPEDAQSRLAKAKYAIAQMKRERS